MSDIGITLRGNHSGLNASLQKAGGDVKKFGDDATRSLRGVQDETRNLHKTLSALGGQMGTALTAGFAVKKVADFTHAIIDAQTNLDKLHNTLSFSLGAGQVTGQMEYLRKTTNDLGLEFGSTAVMYAKFAAAARGTSMEGANTKKVFEGIGKASTVMGLSASDTQGIMLALTQILSKGTVNAEEIRGQLGERLPGAFAIAARAVGATTAEFSKMLELGQVVSADFLPKFADQMEKEVAGSFDKASQSMQSSLNRMSNAWVNFKMVLADDLGLSTAIAFFINKTATGIDNLATSLREMAKSKSATEFFYAAFYSAEALNLELKIGEANLKQLRAKLDQTPDNIYLKSETHQAWLLVQELRAAKAAKDGLSGDTGPGNVSGIAAQYPTRSQSYAADAERVNKIRAGYEAVQQSLSGVSASYLKNLAALKAGFDEGMSTQEQYTKDVIALIDKETGFKKTAAQAQSAAAKAQEEARKAAARAEADWQNEVFKAAESEFEARERSIKTLKDQIDKETAHTAALGLSKEAVADLEVATLYETAAAKDQLATRADQIDWSGQMGDKYREEARLLRELAAAKKAGGVRASELESEREAKKYADDMMKEQKRAAEASEKYWEDALMRAFESGKGFFQSLWDTIKNTLKTQVLKVMVSATGLTGMSAAGAGDLGGSGGNLLGVAGNLGSMYNSLVGGASALGNLGATSIANGVGAVGGDALGTLAALKGGGSAGMATLGTAANYLGAAGMGIFVGGLISGGKSAIGGNSNTAVVAGTAIGALVGGPIGGFVGGAIGGIVNAAFGRGPTQLTSSGTRGTFSGEEFEGVNYANYKKKGGWFRSDKNWTDVTAMAAEARDAWSTAFAGVKGSVTGMAASLGLATDKITAYTKYVDIAAGTTEEQMTAIFTGMADDMALLAAPAVAAFAKSGETASTTLQRLSGSLTTANAWLSMLRNRLFDISLSGADAASKLADAFGSLDNLAASSKAYYDTFYSEAERTAISTENLAKAMALVNVALPTTKDAFREVVSGLDLTTESGRSAYAVMLALAPEFASTAAAAEKMATDTAAALLKAFSGGGQLVPVLNVAALAVGDVAGGAGIMTTALTYINAIMGDASSGVITLGGNIVTLGTGMTASQTSAALLSAEIVLLQGNTDSARIDFVGLGDALASVDTAAFVATIALVFDNLAKRIGGVIDSITNERIAVREAALQIINPTVMSKASIQRGIDGIGTALPSNSAVVAANTTLTHADALVKTAQDKLSAALGYNAAYEDAKTATAALPDFYKGKFDEFVALQKQYNVYANATAGPISYNRDAYAYNAGTNRLNGYGQITYDGGSNVAGFKAAQGPLINTLSAANAKLAESEAALAAARANAVTDLTPYTAALTAAQSSQTTAATAAKKAALDYAASLQTFAIDAGKSVTKLTRLREETVKYYDAQKALADLMSTSAAGLRKTVGDYRYGQLSADDQLAQLQGQFSSAYSLALAAQGDGATLAGYGDRLNGLLGPLIDKLGETNKTNLIANYLAQAESVASLIEQTIPVNYQQDSLDLLGSIDATLAALDASSQSAEAIIADAVRAGSDRTAAGLGAVIAALTGNTIPAFAAGGMHSGGVRLVGENGPEIEVTGPSRIFNASQTRGMLGGGNTARLEALVERQSKQLEALHAELRAINIHGATTADATRHMDRQGVLVYTDPAEPLDNKVAV